jgi:hypothetical protein
MASNPYQLTPLRPVKRDGEWVINPLFVGADAWGADLVYFLDDLNASLLCIYGAPALGKTSLLNHLPVLIPQAQWAIYPDPQEKALDSRLVDYMEKTPEMPLCVAFDDYETSLTEAQQARWFEMNRMLERRYVHCAVVIGQQPLATGLPENLKELLRRKPRFDLTLRSLEPTELQALVEAGPDWIWDPSALELLRELVGGHPYLAQWICSIVADHVTERRFVTVSDVDTAIYRALNAGPYPLHYLWEQLQRPQQRALVAINRLQERRGETEDLDSEGEGERWRPRQVEPVTVADVQDELERHGKGVEFALGTLPDWGRLAAREGLTALEQAVENTRKEIEERADEVRTILTKLPEITGQEEAGQLRQELERSVAALETHGRDTLAHHRRRISILRRRQASVADVEAHVASLGAQEELMAAEYRRLEALVQDAVLRREPALTEVLTQMDALLKDWRAQARWGDPDVRDVLRSLHGSGLIHLHESGPETQTGRGRYTIAAGILDRWLGLHRPGVRRFLRE